jgi:hypothetical protein
VSHHKERKEKICLNCNAAIYGRYCHVCGQENIEPKENFWHLVNHFVEDLTHFDGKFFSTLKYLLLKPGFLSSEYLRGRRASYLHPIRMYVFTSAIFFLISFSFIHLDDHSIINPGEKNDQLIHIGTNFKKSTSDTTEAKKIDSVSKQLQTIANNKKTNNAFVLNGDTIKINSIKEYDSLQSTLPPSKRSSWLKRIYERRTIGLKQNLFSYNESVYKKLSAELLHGIPKMMFILLPLIALVLRLFYIRNKRLLYIDHAIFIIHLFIAIYIFWMLIYGFNFVGSLAGTKFTGWLTLIMFFVIQFYQYKAMRNFYGQGRWKTFFKYVFFNLMTFFIFLIIGIFFFLTTVSEQIN